MTNHPSPIELAWEEQQRTDRAKQALQRRDYIKNFVLVLLLIVLTVTVATLLADWRLAVKEVPAVAR